MAAHLYMPGITIPQAVFLNAPASVLLPIALGTAVGYGTRPSQTRAKYAELKQPPLRPPPWLFGPVWTVLYGVMGYAAHRAVSAGLASLSPPETVRAARASMTLYTVQLGLNLAWMPLFFVAKRPVEAAADVLALVGLNGYLAYLWRSMDPVAALCQAPYLAWLGFASYLCIGAGYLNGWDLSDKPARSDDAKD